MVFLLQNLFLYNLVAMEQEDQQNEKARPTSGVVPKSKAQNENPTIKEGDPKQQRPEYGSDAGVNTANREDQLPSLNNGGAPLDNDEAQD